MAIEDVAIVVNGSVLSGSLRRPGKASSTIVWQVAGVQFRASVQAIRQSLEERVLPLFELFSDRPRVLEYLAAHGGGFLGVCEPESTPMSFMLCFGTREQAQRFFAYYVGSWPARRDNVVKTLRVSRRAGTSRGTIDRTSARTTCWRSAAA